MTAPPGAVRRMKSWHSRGWEMGIWDQEPITEAEFETSRDERSRQKSEITVRSSTRGRWRAWRLFGAIGSNYPNLGLNGEVLTFGILGRGRQVMGHLDLSAPSTVQDYAAVLHLHVRLTAVSDGN